MNPEKWKEDINFLRENLSKKHYNFFTIRNQDLFNKDLDKIVSNLDKLNDMQVAIEIQQSIAKQGDSHTKIIWDKRNADKKIITARTDWFKDGYYFFRTNKEAEKLIGKKLVSINGYSIKQISDSLSTLFTKDNEAIVHENVPRLLIDYELLNYFGFSKDNTYKVTYTDGNKNFEEILLPEIPSKDNSIGLKTKNTPFYLQNAKQFFIDWYFADSKIYYIQYNKCISKEEPSIYKGDLKKIETLPSFVDFENRILKTVEKENFDKIIFDLRLNSGGSSPQGTRLIKKLIENPKVNKKGKLFVIVGRKTFSSAIINAMDFKNSKAIFIGEETSGKPNHFGETDNFTLPNSRLLVYYSKNYFKESKEDLKSLKPDFETSVSIDDAINGIDPAFEFVKNYK